MASTLDHKSVYYSVQEILNACFDPTTNSLRIGGTVGGDLHLNSGQYLTMGNTAASPSSSIGYITSTVNPFVSLTASSASKIIAIGLETTKTTEILGTDVSGFLSDPTIFILPGTPSKTNWSYIQNNGSNRALTFSGSNGNGTDGTLSNSNGVGFTFSPGRGGTLSTGGNAGSFSFSGAVGGGTTGVGSSFSVTSGDGAGSGNAGDIGFNGGTGGTSGRGANINFFAGNGSQSSGTGMGGSLNFTSGNAGSTSNDAGNINFTAGSGTGTNSGGGGYALTLGAGKGTEAGGWGVLTAGASGSTTKGGKWRFVSGANTGTGDSGDIEFAPGTPGSGGVNGHIISTMLSEFRLGVVFAASGQSTLSNYTEGTFTPTVTLTGGAGNTVPVYSTNTGRYTRIGNRVFVDIYLTGDGGNEGAGTGTLNIALPITAASTHPTFYFPAGTYQNSTDYEPIFGQIAGSATTIIFSYEDVLGDLTAVLGNNQNNATRSIRCKFSYEV